MSIGISIPFIIVTICIVICALVFIRLKKTQTDIIKKTDDALSGKSILYTEDSANFFGLESLGLMQVRGNGIFRITEDEIYFCMLMPERVFSFPINKITSIETPKSFLGKSKFVPLLKINFENEAGQNDAAAWIVKDLQTAKAQIESLVK